MPYLLLALILLICLLILLWIFLTPNPPKLVGASTDGDAVWFRNRDAEPQSELPESQWYEQNWNNGRGPKAITYPPAPQPAPSLIEVARHYLGIAYRHHHIPGWDPSGTLTGKPNEGPGLDCSNYTAWIYNYGRGLRFTSDVQEQAVMYITNPNMARIDRPTSDTLPNFQPNDLVYFWRERPDNTREISHVGMFTEYRGIQPHMIDSHGVGVTEHRLAGWYKIHFSHAIRIQ